MSTRFFVEKATHIVAAKAFLLDGKVVEGCLKGGDVVHSRAHHGQSIRVKSIALVSTKIPTDVVTISIEDPGFPICDLEGAELVCDE